MSAQTSDDEGLAAFGAGVAEPVEERDTEPDRDEAGDGTEAAAIDEFESEPVQQPEGYDGLHREFVRQGHHLERTAAALDREPRAVLSDLADHGDVRVDRLDAEWLAHLFDAHERDMEAVAEAARESGLAVNVRLVRAGIADPQDMAADCLREVYDERNGEYYQIRDALESPERDVLEALVDIGLVEEHEEYFVARLWPHELGLSRLNCGNKNCTEGTAIGSYPCPDCGHDPGNGYDDRGEGGDDGE